ncbi:MAG: hypothetical protein U0787_23990, partial [Polyangia bacterium]
LAGFSDWPGAQSLLKQLPQERSLPTADAVAELRRLLGTLRSRQLDLYEGVKALSVAQSDDQSGGSLSDLVTSAIRKLS